MSFEYLVRRTFILLRNGRDWILAQIFFGSMWFLKLFSADLAINTTEKLARRFGMLYPRTRQARENLTLAFPEKSSQEIEAILRAMWGNLGRTAAEYVYLDKIFDFDIENPTAGRFEIAGIEKFIELLDYEGPIVFFTAHTGNWEILPVGSAAYGLNITALFRPPNNQYIAKRVLAARTTSMGHTVPSKAGASWALASVMDEGGKVGILVDQFFRKGIPIDFFGHETLANPLLAKLVRQYDCPVYPARCIRLDGGRFRLELQDALEIPRLDSGAVDTYALTVSVNKVVEQWVREYPEQWLWLHKRWRPNYLKKWHARRKKRREKLPPL